LVETALKRPLKALCFALGVGTNVDVVVLILEGRVTSTSDFTAVRRYFCIVSIFGVIAK